MAPRYQNSKRPVCKVAPASSAINTGISPTDDEMLAEASERRDIVMSSPDLGRSLSHLFSTGMLIDFDNDIIMGNTEDNAANKHLEALASPVVDDLMDIDQAGWEPVSKHVSRSHGK